jgi:hypothetical protein
MKKIEFLYFTVAKKMCVNCSTLSSSCHFFCQLLETSLARINWIRAVDNFYVEQLISCQKCRANDCRAIEFQAVHPHSIAFDGFFRTISQFVFLLVYFKMSFTILSLNCFTSEIVYQTTKKPFAAFH